MALISNSATRSYDAAAAAAAKKRLGTASISSGIPNQNQTATAFNQVKPVVNDTDPNAVAVPYGVKPVVTPTGTPTGTGTGVPTAGSLDEYLNNMKGGFGKITVNPLGTLDDYKKTAGTQLNSNLSKALASLLANYTGNIAAYDGQYKSVGLNANAELAANNRGTTASQNNYSNSTLGRGLGRSTVATTGIGEIGAIGDRINSETEARKSAALDAIDKMKAAAKVGYDASVLSANDGYTSDVDALANELYNKQMATNQDNERFNLGQDTALYQAATNARDKALANQNDIDIANIAYAKSTDVADKNNATKVVTTKLTTGTSADNNKRTTGTSASNNKRTTATSTANNKRTTSTSSENNKRTTSTSSANNIRSNATSASNTQARIAASKAKAAKAAVDKASKGTAQGKNYETSHNKIVSGAYGTQDKANILKNVLADVKNDAKLNPTERANLIKKISTSINTLSKKQQAINTFRAGNGGS